MKKKADTQGTMGAIKGGQVAIHFTYKLALKSFKLFKTTEQRI